MDCNIADMGVTQFPKREAMPTTLETQQEWDKFVIQVQRIVEVGRAMDCAQIAGSSQVWQDIFFSARSVQLGQDIARNFQGGQISSTGKLLQWAEEMKDRGLILKLKMNFCKNWNKHEIGNIKMNIESRSELKMKFQS